jgi:hypothetical protein
MTRIMLDEWLVVDWYIDFFCQPSGISVSRCLLHTLSLVFTLSNPI